MRRIITYGTFDTLHFGHINILRQAAQQGAHLTVGISTDRFNLVKGKQAFHNYVTRALNVGALRYVDCIIPETSWLQKISDITEYKIDALVMGSDWEGKFDFLKNACEVIILPRTEGISSTILKEIINK